MQCNKCHKRLPIDNYSYYIKKNNSKIYYLSCNECRNKYLENNNIREKLKQEYENRKNNNVINCCCGINYVAFRNYHISRHESSKKHKELLII